MSRIPRFFPPRYFRDRWFWLAAIGNAAVLAWDIWICWIDRGSDFFLALVAGALAMQTITTARFLRTMWRDSKDWRTRERAHFAAWLAERDAEFERLRPEIDAAIQAVFEKNARQQREKRE
jgi:hypothetical protein